MFNISVFNFLAFDDIMHLQLGHFCIDALSILSLILLYLNISQIGRYFYDNKVYGIDRFTKNPVEPFSHTAVLYDIPNENKLFENIIYLMRKVNQ